MEYGKQCRKCPETARSKTTSTAVKRVQVWVSVPRPNLSGFSHYSATECVRLTRFTGTLQQNVDFDKQVVRTPTPTLTS